LCEEVLGNASIERILASGCDDGVHVGGLSSDFSGDLGLPTLFVPSVPLLIEVVGSAARGPEGEVDDAVDYAVRGEVRRRRLILVDVVWTVVSVVAIGAEVELAKRSGDPRVFGTVTGEVIPDVLEDGPPGEAVGAALIVGTRVIPPEEPLGWPGGIKRICRPSRAGRKRLEGPARMPLRAVKFELELIGRDPVRLHQVRMQDNCRLGEGSGPWIQTVLHFRVRAGS